MFFPNDVGIYVCTKKEYDCFINILDILGYEWMSGRKMHDVNYYDKKYIISFNIYGSDVLCTYHNKNKVPKNCVYFKDILRTSRLV